MENDFSESVFTNEENNDFDELEEKLKGQPYFISYSFWQYTYDNEQPEGDTVEGFGNTVEKCVIEYFEDIENLEAKIKTQIGVNSVTIINFIPLRRTKK